MNTHKGFTLAEVLICIAILGVIATFSISKILQGAQYERSNAIFKEDVAALPVAYQAYSLSLGTTVPSTFKLPDLKPYLNYVSQSTTAVVDTYPTNGSIACVNSLFQCLMMHNGSAIIIWTSHSFGATNPNSSINMWIDPDGVSDVAPGGGSSSNLASIGIGLLFTYSGRVMVDQSIPRPIWYQ